MYDEADVLPLFLVRLRPVLDHLAVPYEVVVIDDGSRDATADLVGWARQDWPQLRLVRLLRNAGHQAAIGAGLQLSRGDYVVTIDADLQDPPEEIAAMLELARSSGVDVVYGVRVDRSADSQFKRASAGAYYRLMRRLAGPQVPSDAGDFRLVSRRVVDALLQLPEHGRVYRLLIPWLGFPATEHRYVRQARAAGRSKYPLRAMARLGWDSVTAFSAAPLRLATYAGLFGALMCGVFIVWALAMDASGDTVPGWASTILVVMAIGALQLLCLGLLGEYVGRLFAAAQGRPPYLVGYDSRYDTGPLPSPGPSPDQQRDTRQPVDREPTLQRYHRTQPEVDRDR